MRSHGPYFWSIALIIALSVTIPQGILLRNFNVILPSIFFDCQTGRDTEAVEQTDGVRSRTAVYSGGPSVTAVAASRRSAIQGRRLLQIRPSATQRRPSISGCACVDIVTEIDSLSRGLQHADVVGKWLCILPLSTVLYVCNSPYWNLQSGNILHKGIMTRWGYVWYIS